MGSQGALKDAKRLEIYWVITDREDVKKFIFGRFISLEWLDSSLVFFIFLKHLETQVKSTHKAYFEGTFFGILLKIDHNERNYENNSSVIFEFYFFSGSAFHVFVHRIWTILISVGPLPLQK